MAWQIEGRYFENCSCELVCPCTASFADSAPPVWLTGVFHPAGHDLAVAKADAESHLSAFGLDLQNGGKSGFSNQFAWRD